MNRFTVCLWIGMHSTGIFIVNKYSYTYKYANLNKINKSSNLTHPTVVLCIEFANSRDEKTIVQIS